MSKKFLFIAMLGIAGLSVFVACDKKDKDVVDEITIYGTVVDADSGDPIQNAQISLYKDYFSEEQQKEDMDNGGAPGAIGSAVTGSDGSYEFTISDINRKYEYVVEAKKKGYQEGFALKAV